MFDSSSDVPSLHTEAKWKGFAVAQTHPSSIRENGRVQISDVKNVLPNSKKKMYAKSGPFQKRLALFRSIYLLFSSKRLVFCTFSNKNLSSIEAFFSSYVSV